MKALSDLLGAIANACLLSGDGAINFGNRHFMLSSADLEKDLANVLYSEWYICGDARGTLTWDKETSAGKTEEFIRFLDTYNHGYEGWEKGWTLQEQHADGSITALKQKMEIVLPAGDHRPEKQVPYVSGQKQIPVERFRRKRSANTSFYYVWSQAPVDKQAQLVRFFFNCRHEGAGALVQFVTKNLNAQMLPFSFKCLIHPDVYAYRADNSVLYVQPGHARRIFELISEQHANLEQALGTGIPLFTKPLYKGVGFGEDPNTMMHSFGTLRCQLIAKCLIAALRHGVPATERAEHMLASLSRMGYREELFYLNAGSRDIYHF